MLQEMYLHRLVRLLIDVTIDGQLNMNASTGTTNTIINLTTPTNDYDLATKKYVDIPKQIFLVVLLLPLTHYKKLKRQLLVESIASDLITMIGTKLQGGEQMSGNIVMDSNEITGLPNPPTSGSHATSKDYVDGILGQLLPQY